MSTKSCQSTHSSVSLPLRRITPEMRILEFSRKSSTPRCILGSPGLARNHNNSAPKCRKIPKNHTKNVRKEHIQLEICCKVATLPLLPEGCTFSSIFSRQSPHFLSMQFAPNAPSNPCPEAMWRNAILDFPEHSSCAIGQRGRIVTRRGR